MNKLLVGSRGFIGSRLREEMAFDEMDISLGQDVREGIYKKYKTIVFLACNQNNTREAYRENLQMYDALDAYRGKYPRTYLIFLSSAAVYFPTSIYSQSKRIGEVYAKRFSNCTVLRPSNVYGRGDGHGAPDRFQRGEKEIHGTGKQIRDLIPVETVIDEIIELINSPQYGTFNVSSGAGTTVNEMFALFGEGKPKYIKHDSGVYESILKPGQVW